MFRERNINGLFNWHFVSTIEIDIGSDASPQNYNMFLIVLPLTVADFIPTSMLPTK
jgi:hypothetical protein